MDSDKTVERMENFIDTWGMSSTLEGPIREPIVEGLFYPDDPNLLKEELIRLTTSLKDLPGNARAILSPHASYEKCGMLIAKAFHAAEKRTVDKVILIGPVHREEEDEILLPESVQFRTPLGCLPVDLEGVEALYSSGTRFIRNDIPHLEEHCLEVQLPFIHYFFPKAKIIPILLGKTSIRTVRLLSHALQSVFSTEWDHTLLVISSNASWMTLRDEAERDASHLLELIQARDWKSLVEEHAAGRLGACGIGGIAAVLEMFGSSVTVSTVDRIFVTGENEGKGIVYLSLSFQVA